MKFAATAQDLEILLLRECLGRVGPKHRVEAFQRPGLFRGVEIHFICGGLEQQEVCGV